MFVATDDSAVDGVRLGGAGVVVKRSDIDDPLAIEAVMRVASSYHPCIAVGGGGGRWWRRGDVMTD